MSQDPLLVLNLKEAAERYIYSATCTNPKCRRHKNVDLKALCAKYDDDIPVRNVRKWLTCECGAKNPIISMIPNNVTWAPP